MKLSEVMSYMKKQEPDLCNYRHLFVNYWVKKNNKHKGHKGPIYKNNIDFGSDIAYLKDLEFNVAYKIKWDEGDLIYSVTCTCGDEIVMIYISAQLDDLR